MTAQQAPHSPPLWRKGISLPRARLQQTRLRAIHALSLLAVVLTAVAVSVMVLVLSGAKLAEAAFPGPNGNIVFSWWISSQEQGIYSIPPTGGAVTRLINTSTEDSPAPDVAPGGKKIAYVDKATDGKVELFTIPIQGGTPTRLTNNGISEGSPSWSPDGKRIAYTAYDGNDKEIYTISSSGRDTPTKLTNNATNDGAPEWSPSGRWIAYHHFDGNDYEIAIMSSSGGLLYYLTNDSRGDGYPDWAPDGSKIVYSHYDFEGHGSAGYVEEYDEGDNYDDADIYSVPSSGGSPTEVTDTSISWWETTWGCGGNGCLDSSESEQHPAYSPNGKMIAFAKQEYAPRDCFSGFCPSLGRYELYTMPSSGGSYQKLTDDADYVTTPDWGQAPDNSPPETTITSGPSGYINSSTTSFGFTSNERFSSFRCLLENPDAMFWAWGDCTSPQQLYNLKDNTYTFKVAAIDVAGNGDPTPARRTFTVDTIKPRVVQTSPAANSTDVALGANVTATFSEAMKFTTVVPASKLYTSGSTTPMDALISYDPSTKEVTIDPYPDNLKPNTTYKAVVRTEVQDLATNPLDQNLSQAGNQNKVWYFTTRS